MYRTGFGQDSHAFCKEKKPLILAGIKIAEEGGFSADSDGDLIFHTLCNAITSLTGVPILGDLAMKMCKEGEKNSRVYLEKALFTLKGQKIVHVAISLEGQKPRLEAKLSIIRKSLAEVLQIRVSQVGITVTSGDFLTEFGKGRGMQCFCVITTKEEV